MRAAARGEEGKKTVRKERREGRSGREAGRRKKTQTVCF